MLLLACFCHGRKWELEMCFALAFQGVSVINALVVTLLALKPQNKWISF